MGQKIYCSSCGKPNELPNGRSSMFCAFCGNGIGVNSNESKSCIISKPKISYDYDYENCIDYTSGILKLTNRDIKSLDEITKWYSDNELNTIEELDLSDNNITSLKGIEKFSGAKSIKLSNNKITTLSDIDINSINLIDLKERDGSCMIILDNNSFINYEWLDKINYDKILRTVDGYFSYESKYDFTQIKIIADLKTVIKFHPQSKYAEEGYVIVKAREQEAEAKAVQKAKNQKALGCFVFIILFIVVVLKIISSKT